MLHLYSAISLCISVHHAVGSDQIYVVLPLSESAGVSLKSRDNTVTGLFSIAGKMLCIMTYDKTQKSRQIVT